MDASRKLVSIRLPSSLVTQVEKVRLKEYPMATKQAFYQHLLELGLLRRKDK